MAWDDGKDLKQGPFEVAIRKGEFVDEDRNARLVPYKIYYPTGHGMDKIPIIVWSHGFGGNHDGAAFLSRYVASYGYILIHLTHIGTDSRLWEGKDEHPWDILKRTKVKRSTTLSRFADVPFALDRLKMWAQDHPADGDFMDFDHIGISGHSFGALTSQVMAGMLFPNDDHKFQSYKEDRFKAGILYSPVPIDHLGADDAGEMLATGKVYNTIDIPLMHMTGTDDGSPISGESYEHRFVVFENTHGIDRYMLIKDGGDHMVYNGTRGKLAVNPKRETHEEIVQVSSLAFWDAYLKDDEAAKTWLHDGGLQGWLGDEAEFKK